MINHKDISVVVQGALSGDTTRMCLSSIRKYLPEVEVVLSTWEGSDIGGLDCDALVLNEDPGGDPVGDYPGAGKNNVNRQIRTTLNGLQKAAGKYVLKLRTDFILSGSDFLQFYGRFQAADRNYKIFECKILSCVFFARNPRMPEPLLFHPSDIAFFGLRTDLLNLFDVPFITKEESVYYKNGKYGYRRYVPEQHIWVNCLRKNGKEIDFDHQRSYSDEVAEDTEKYAVSNFIYLDWKQFNLIPPKHLTTFVDNELANVITHIEWQRLYCHYLDQTLDVPERDDVREYINKMVWAHDFFRFMLRLATLWLRLKPFMNFRDRVIKKITHYLIRGAHVPY